MEASEELFAHLSNRVRICYQTFGNPDDPAVILVAGHAGSMLEFPEDLINLMSPADSTNRYFVIRYDHRDTGLSTEFPVPANYSLADMAGDIEGLVDHIGLASKGFHIVGASKGGMMAYLVAARRAGQCKSLTLLLTSPGISKELPQKEFRDYGNVPMFIGAGDQKQMHIDAGMRVWEGLATAPTDDDRKEQLALRTRIVERESKSGTLYSKEPNHGDATTQDEKWPGFDALKKIECPTTVLQAAKDPIFGEIHGEALAEAISGAEYVLWNDIGHELPRRVWVRLTELLQRTWQKG